MKVSCLNIARGGKTVKILNITSNLWFLDEILDQVVDHKSGLIMAKYKINGEAKEQ